MADSAAAAAGDDLGPDWQKCFSNTRKREYFFNSKTGQSLWTIEEVRETNRRRRQDIQRQQQQQSKSKSTTTSSTTTSKSATGGAEMNIEYEEDEKMEIEIVENIQKIRNLHGDSNIESSFSLNVSSNSNIHSSQAAATADSDRIMLGIVLDTNIFISHLNQVKEVANKYQNSSELLFIVPWVVVQELDRLKSNSPFKTDALESKSISTITKRAQEAIYYISSLINERSRKFQFESSAQSKEESPLIKCITNDDYILKCALIYANIYSNTRICLLTNDRNLINKSIISNLESFNFKSFESNVNNLLLRRPTPQTPSVQHYQTVKTKSFAAADPVAASTSQNSSSSSSSTVLKSSVANLNGDLTVFLNELSGFMSDFLMEIVFQLLSAFYENQMQNAYGDVWPELLLHKKPWNFQGLMANMNKSFSALFCFDQSFKRNTIDNHFKRFRDDLDQFNLYKSRGNHFLTANLNKTFSPIELLKLAIRASSDLLSFCQLFQQSKDLEAQILIKLELILKYSMKLLKLYEIIERLEIEIFDQNRFFQNGTPVSFQLFEPIWKHYHTCCHQDVLTHLRSIKSYSNSDYVLEFHFLVCVQSIGHLRSFYEKCLNQSMNLACLANLALLIYVMYKLLDIDANDLSDEQAAAAVDATLINNEYLKYDYLESNLRNCFNSMNNELVNHGYIELLEFEKSIKSIAHVYFNTPNE